MNSRANPQFDATTIRRFIAGDEGAFNVVYERLAPEVLAFLTARMSKREDAEEVSQITWMEVSSNCGRFDGRNIRAWIFEIARNRLVDRTRQQRRQRTVELSDQIEPVTFSDSSLALIRREELAAFAECAKSVGGKFVEALLNVYITGQSPDELADAERVSRGAIYTRVHRGRQQIEECLENKGRNAEKAAGRLKK